MSAAGSRRSRHLSLVSGGRVVYLASQAHQCKRCRLTWNPEQVGPLCPDCDKPEGEPA